MDEDGWPCAASSRAVVWDLGLPGRIRVETKAAATSHSSRTRTDSWVVPLRGSQRRKPLIVAFQCSLNGPFPRVCRFPRRCCMGATWRR